MINVPEPVKPADPDAVLGISTGSAVKANKKAREEIERQTQELFARGRKVNVIPPTQSQPFAARGYEAKNKMSWLQREAEQKALKEKADQKRAEQEERARKEAEARQERARKEEEERKAREAKIAEAAAKVARQRDRSVPPKRLPEGAPRPKQTNQYKDRGEWKNREAIAALIRRHCISIDYLRSTMNVAAGSINRWLKGENRPGPADVELLEFLVYEIVEKKKGAGHDPK